MSPGLLTRQHWPSTQLHTEVVSPVFQRLAQQSGWLLLEGVRVPARVELASQVDLLVGQINMGLMLPQEVQAQYI